MSTIEDLADRLVLGALLQELTRRFDGWELLDHWREGEYHHDLVLRVARRVPGRILVVSTNRNGGIKEILALTERPTREALWSYRRGRTTLAPLAAARTLHWFDPCELLGENRATA
jgi:hypothetical protein